MAGFTPTNRDGSLTKPSDVVSSTGKFKPVARISKPQEKPLSNKIVDFIGLKPASDVIASHIARARAPEELKQYIEKPTIKQDIGSAMQILATIMPFNIARNVAAKGAAGIFSPVARDIVGEAAAGASAGYAFDVGGNLAEGKEVSESLTPGVGTAVGVIGGPLLTGIGKTIASRALRNKTPEQFAEEAAARAPYTVPEAGKPTLPQQAVIDATQGIKLLPEPRTPVIELPSPQITASQRLINEVPRTPEPAPIVPDKTSPDISIRAKAFNSRDEFIASEQAKNVGTKLVTSKTGQAVEKSQVLRKVSKPQLTKIWNDAHRTQPYEMLSYQKAPIAIGKRGMDTSIGTATLPKAQRSATRVEASEIPATRTSPEGVGYKEREIPSSSQAIPEQEYVKAEKALEVDPTYVPGTDREKISLFNKTLAENLGKVDDFLDAIYNVNGKKLPQGLTRSAAYVLMREQAQLLTPKQLQRLTNSEPLSKAGQDLQAAKVKAGQILTNPMDMVDKLKAELLDKAEKVLTSKGMKSFLDDLECK